MLAMCGRDLPTASAMSSCVRPKRSIRAWKPCASSIGLRSVRCTFSTIAISSTSTSLNSRMTAGIVCRPARCAARQRRSPATISYLPSAIGRTRIGCSTPCVRMEFDSSFRSPSSNVRRGCCGLRCTRSIGNPRGPSVAAAACVGAAATGATTGAGAGIGTGACGGCCVCATGSSNTLRGGSTGAGRVSFVAGQAGALAGVGVSVRTGSPSNAERPRPSPRGLKSLIALVSVPTRFGFA